TNRDTFLKKLDDHSLDTLFHYEKVHKGDVFFIPAGRIHAIGSGNRIAEIQQTSDITYRIYDYERKDSDGNERELHLDLALDVIDYSKANNTKKTVPVAWNQPVELVSCAYFVTNRLDLNHSVERDFYAFDSFVILMCLDGAGEVGKEGGKSESIGKGETLLVPAALNSIRITPKTPTLQLLEIYIP
ncbi:MAG TPA: mannose-6-phosphate isomerase, partial [Prolixibacteraceae bacterium]|nr:mannose-6-phosphate isomerase [Prolixibacteraceae bacterium]